MNKNHKPSTYLYAIVITAMTTVWLANATSAEPHNPTKVAPVDYKATIAQLEKVIEGELQQGTLTGLSVALIDGQQVVHAAGYGMADKQQQIPADAETIYRVGSISKVFTAIAAMQLVEQGKLDLDQPIQNTLPNFSIVTPFDGSTPLTLRQFMCHRSGMIRESPVGSYFDDSEPSIDQSVASIAPSVLVNSPNTKTRYSNIGATITGQAVAMASESSYEQYLRKNLLGPIGMDHSSWRIDDRISAKLAAGYMRVADGQRGFANREAPKFELGTIPAGNLYSSVNDMTLFAKMLLAKGALSEEGRIVSAETLEQMSTPQLTDNDTGFGLGFYVGHYGNNRTIQHTGAVYGFSASLVVLPEVGIAAIVLTNTDLVSGRVKKISEAALDLMLTAKIDKPMPMIPASLEIDREQLTTFVGHYESSGHWAEVKVVDNQLMLDLAGQPLTARPIGPLEFEIDGRLVYRGRLEFKQNEENQIIGFHALGQDFARITSDPSPLPASWKEYLGSYGPDFIPLVISEHHGHLYAMTENMIDYRLTPVNTTVFKMPEGLYADEHLVFERDVKGRVHTATLANMQLRRQP